MDNRVSDLSLSTQSKMAIHSVNRVLHDAGVPLILWGELAMKKHGIRTVLIREDILVPDDMLDIAASALRAKGWTDSKGPLPVASAGFWMRGWEIIGDACRRFHYPGRESSPSARELLILPTSFVGLDPAPSLLIDFTRDDHHHNIYCPSSRLLLTTIIHTALLHPAGKTFLQLMQAWMSYFCLYLGFDATSLDDADEDVRVYWKALCEEYCL